MTFHKIACTHIHIITIIYRNVGSVIKVQKKSVLDGREQERNTRDNFLVQKWVNELITHKDS